ncbi:MAG: hypothetical protein AB7P21_20030 [Lautropia sp.]
MSAPIRAAAANARHERGLVLPVVLFLLVIVTVVVSTQLKRGLLDERLATSLRSNVVSDSAVQTVLRWCELRLSAAPLETQAIAAPGRATATMPAWRDGSNWLPATTFRFTGVSLPGAIDHACLIERADGELAASISDSGFAADPADTARWLKFRITARVQRDGGGFEHAQSEMRLYRD